MRTRSRARAQRVFAYAFAVGGAAGVFTLRDTYLPWLKATFIIHVPTIVVAAWFGGLRPGLLANDFKMTAQIPPRAALDARAAGSFQIENYDDTATTHAAQDPSSYFWACFGDQA